VQGVEVLQLTEYAVVESRHAFLVEEFPTVFASEGGLLDDEVAQCNVC
jgi:hypothetical protein